MTNDVSKMTEAMASALASIAAGAHALMGEALKGLPAVHAKQITRAVDAGQCALTIQCDWPSMTITVLADGEGWLAPQVLFATKWPGPTK